MLSEDPDAYPPDPTPYLNNSTLMALIGAESDWSETNYDVYQNFADTGDWMRNSRPDLETVIDSGVRTIVFDGDAVGCFVLGMTSGSQRTLMHTRDCRTTSLTLTASRRW